MRTKRGLEYEAEGGGRWHIRLGGTEHDLSWQHGTVPLFGRNGFQPDELLELVAERIRQLNAGHPCRENSAAITKIEEAIFWLEERTRDRLARGVEGTEVP